MAVLLGSGWIQVSVQGEEEEHFMEFGGEVHFFEMQICKYIFNPVFTSSIMSVGNVYKIETVSSGHM